MDSDIESNIIQFRDLYVITDQDSVSMHERAMIVNFYIFILELQNVSCDVHCYKSEEKTLAFKDIINQFHRNSIHDFEKLHRKLVSPSRMVDMINDHIVLLNRNFDLFAKHYNVQNHKLVKVESKNDWISPRMKSDWDIRLFFEK